MGLSGIEFRISPFDRPSDYARFFAGLGRHRHSFVANGNAEVAFVVHFIRHDPSSSFLEPRGGRNGGRLRHAAPSIDDEAVRRLLDRQSAALHRFRCAQPSLASRIVGIDVANVERRNPVHLFSPYLRLLRLRSPDSLPIGRRAHFTRWREIVAERLHVMPTGVPPLGLTFHVGEDAFHPLDGLKSVWEYMNFCDVRSGDRIGHGLALGIDVAAFNAAGGRSSVMPAGAALDLLAWLRHRLAVMERVGAIAMRAIEDDMAMLSRRIYGSSRSPTELYGLVRRRHGIGKDAGERWKDPGAQPDAIDRLLDLECDRVVVERRNTYAPLPASLLREDLSEGFVALQDDIVAEAIRRELYVEANPSSNVNILGLTSAGDHPVLRALKRHPALRVTINTDDPGTFATSLDLEYSVARDGLRHLGFERIDRMLERFARHSEQSAFCTPPLRRWRPLDRDSAPPE